MPMDPYDRDMAAPHPTSIKALALGDALACLVVTLVGFTSHGNLDSTTVMRILATFLPFYLSWLLFAYWGGLHRSVFASPVAWLGHAAVTAILAAPFAAFLRGVWLGTPIHATFTLVMAGVSSAGILLWRAAYHYFLHSRISA